MESCCTLQAQEYLTQATIIHAEGERLLVTCAFKIPVLERVREFEGKLSYRKRVQRYYIFLDYANLSTKLYKKNDYNGLDWAVLLNQRGQLRGRDLTVLSLYLCLFSTKNHAKVQKETANLWQ